MKKSNLNLSVLFIITLNLFFFASCNKKEETAATPDYGGIDAFFPNATLKWYGAKNDWLNDTNVLFSQFSKTGKFSFNKSYADGTYYYDIYDSAYIHSNNRDIEFRDYYYLQNIFNLPLYKVKAYKSNSRLSSSDISDCTDPKQNNYQFLGGKPYSNWKMTSYSGIGANAPACGKLRNFKITKEWLVTINDGSICTDQQEYTYGFLSYQKGSEAYWSLLYLAGKKWISSSYLRLIILEKKNGIAIKIKLTDDVSPTKNYEIYERQ